MITCHLGNGCSVCAIDHGQSIDTSMGFTPLEGLIMGTRSGDVDAGAILYLITNEGITAPELLQMLNSSSGLKGHLRRLKRYARFTARSQARK